MITIKFPGENSGEIFVDKTVNTVYNQHTQLREAGNVNIFIDNKSALPIYDQIYTQIKNQIMSGALTQDEALPSIRNLAKDLRISVITTKRAYEELEKEGFIYTVAAKGCFVAPKNLELLREENLKAIEGHLTEAVRLAAACGLSGGELEEMLRYEMEDGKMNAIEIKGLTKSYCAFKLDGLDLTLPCGCIMGLVGENGAGKSTTIRLMLGIWRARTAARCLRGRDGRN